MADGISTIPLRGKATGTQRAAQRPLEAAQSGSEFTAGPENALAVAALTPLLQASESAFSPILLLGPHGSGKTHLACGLADWWRQQFPRSAVQYFTGAEFAQAYAAALKDQTLDEWREQIRSAELLVLEDLGELVGKQAAQQELRHTLDALADSEARVILTARTLPSNWKGLSPGLRSRLSAALPVPLALPTRSTRRAILKEFAASRGLKLPPRVADNLADGLTGGVPALLAALQELELTSAASGQLDAARVGSLIHRRREEAAPTVHQIAKLVARHFGLKLSELKSPQRRRALVAGRCVAMYLARQLTTKSLAEIGDFFGGRDHTTVLHGCRRTEKLLTRDAAVRQAVADVKRMLASA